MNELNGCKGQRTADTDTVSVKNTSDSRPRACQGQTGSAKNRKINLCQVPQIKERETQEIED